MRKTPWIFYTGKGQPVADNVVVDVWLRREKRGTFHSQPFPAAAWNWRHDRDGEDIIAYRLVHEG